MHHYCSCKFGHGNMEHRQINITISKVLNILTSIMCNMLVAGGGNELVKSKRGKQIENIKVEDVIQKIQNYPNKKTTYGMTIIWLMVTATVMAISVLH